MTPDDRSIPEPDVPWDTLEARRKAKDVANGRIHWSPEVSLGAAIQAGVVCIGLVAWAVTSTGRAEQAQHDIAQMRADVSGQIKDLREALQSSVSEMRSDLRAVPNRLDNVDKWIGQQEARTAAADQRVLAAYQEIADLRATVSAIGATLNEPLQPRRTR